MRRSTWLQLLVALGLRTCGHVQALETTPSTFFCIVSAPAWNGQLDTERLRMSAVAHRGLQVRVDYEYLTVDVGDSGMQGNPRPTEAVRMVSADGSSWFYGLQTHPEWRAVHSLGQTTVRKPAEFIKCHGDTMPGWMTRVQLLHVMSALIWHQLVRSRLRPAQIARNFVIKPRRPWVQESPSRTLCAPFLCVARIEFSHIRLH